MQITLHRCAGLLNNTLARGWPLYVFFDGQLVAQLALGETRSLQLPDRIGHLCVGLAQPTLKPIKPTLNACYFRSQTLQISLADADQYFSIRTRFWVIADILNLGLLPYFAQRCLSIDRMRDERAKSML